MKKTVDKKFIVTVVLIWSITIIVSAGILIFGELNKPTASTVKPSSNTNLVEDDWVDNNLLTVDITFPASFYADAKTKPSTELTAEQKAFFDRWVDLTPQQNELLEQVVYEFK